MKYEPQVNDILTREGFPPITLAKITKSTAKYLYKGEEVIQPRTLFESMIEKALANNMTVTREGKQIIPSTEELAGTSGSHNTHARLAPSASKTWTTCTAAPAYVEANKHLIPADSSSVYSEEGTTAHDYAADILLKKKELTDIPLAFQDAVGAYVDHCLSLVPEGENYEVEVQVPLYYQPDQTGTCDFACITEDRVIVRDYKHGAGVLVISEANPQLAIYAYSMIQYLSDIYEFNDDTIIDIKVVQPRHHMAEDDEAWVLPLSEFREFCKAIAEQAEIATVAVEAVKQTLEPLIELDESYNTTDVLSAAPKNPAVFAPQDGDGGSCRWCKAKGFCGARHADNTGDRDTSAMLALMPDMTKEESKLDVAERIDLQVVFDSEDEIVPRDGETLRLDYLIAVFKNKKKIEKFLSDVQDYLENMAATKDLPDLKWVQGRQGNRAWANEDEAEVFCKNQKLKLEERCTLKLKTPAQIEALLRENLKNTRTKNRFEQLVTRSDGRPVLVPADDKRPALAAPGDIMPDCSDEDI
jgi:hypothetical protein